MPPRVTVFERLDRVGSSPRTTWVAVGTLVGSLCFGLLLPIYTDEIVWRFHERAALDGGFDVWLNDICGPNTVARAPWFMMPTRWFSATMNLALPSPLFVRLEGIACALLWLGMFWRLTARLEQNPARLNATRTAGFCLLGMGLLPLLMVMSRPEQPIVLAISTMLLIATSRLGAQERVPLKAAWMRSAAIVVLATIALSYHLKGVVYAPVAAVCIVTCARGPRTLLPRMIALAILVMLTALAAIYWTERFSCGGDALVAARLGTQNIAAMLAGKSATVIPLLPGLIKNAFPWAYIPQTVPSPDPQSSWIPPGHFTAIASRLFGMGQRAIWWTAILLGVAAAIRFVRNERLAAMTEPRLLQVGAIVACLSVWGFSQVGKNFYESAHVLPLLAIAIVIAISLGRPASLVWRVLPAVAALVIVPAVLSQGLVAASLATAFVESARRGGAIPEQRLSISAFGYARIREDISYAAHAAGISSAPGLNRPVIDDLTYLALQRSHLPIHRLGLFDWWSGSIAKNPVAYLFSRGSAGVIVACSSLPENWRAIAHQSGEICALGRAQLANLRIPHETLPPPESGF